MKRELDDRRFRPGQLVRIYQIVVTPIAFMCIPE